MAQAAGGATSVVGMDVGADEDAKADSSELEPGQGLKLFGQLLDMFRFYLNFEIDETSGDALSDHDMTRYEFVSIHFVCGVIK